METVATKAARLSRRREFERFRQQSIDSSEGIETANEAVATLKASVKKFAEEIARSNKEAQIDTREVRESFLLRGLGPVMVMTWWYPHSNTLKGSELRIEFSNRITEAPRGNSGQGSRNSGRGKAEI